MKKIVYVSAYLLSAVMTTPVTAALYRWVDEAGEVHYTDKIPPQEVERAHQELNPEGVTTKKVERAKTAEEVAQEQALKKLRLEQQKVIDEQKAKDQVLLRTFRSEDDMILALNGKLEAIDVGIRVTQSSIRRQQTKLAELQQKAATLERSGKETPATLVTNIQGVLNQIHDSYATIQRKEQDKQAIRDVFEQERKRFRELKKLPENRPDQSVQTIPLQQNLVPCGQGAACEQIWKKTEAFVRAHATMTMQMQADNLIMTAPPLRDEDISITVSRLKDKNSGQVSLFLDLFCKDSPRGKELCASNSVAAIRQNYRQAVTSGQ